ncbi:hypothetical protein F4859DRAFT_490107 [Xylaria cf. heliscus]|nr:hypothetical protein F4859DRAFT_490107 [Xylaria cf. heliscus]
MSGKIRLLEVSPGSGEEAIEIKRHGFEQPTVPYVACAAFTDRCDFTSTTSTDSPGAGGSDAITLPAVLEQMTQQLRDPEVSVYMWIDHLCTETNPPGQQMEYQYPTSLKDIYTAAKECIIWAGNDHDTSDEECFDRFLVMGNGQTTEHAFNFASRLAEADLSDIPPLFDERCSIDTNTHSWVYLFRILCRPFFRGLPLLRTNYVSGLARAVVLCGRTRISFNTLRQAAHRIWAVFPIPYFFQNIKESLDNEDDQITIMKADRAFLLSCLRFGLDSFAVLGRIREFFIPTENDSAPRFLVHLGYCDDIYCGVQDNVSAALVRQAVGETQELGSDPTTFIQKAVTQNQNTEPPSLALEGYIPCPPRAEDQAPFVHQRVHCGNDVRLVRLLPASCVNEPLQCGVVDIPVDKIPEFRVVLNDTFIRKRLEFKNFHGVQFPITTRSTVAMLVNGQAFVIPKIQEVFLRLVRDSSQPVHLFLWNICMSMQRSGLGTRADIARYLAVKRYVKLKGNGDEIDMYEVLDNAGQRRERHELEALGLPKTRSWDEWLLELND